MAEDHRPPILTPRLMRYGQRAQQFLRDYSWFVLRNIIGWILILTAPALGVALPGPGGLPVFLIGFALVTFPGKRRLTARMLRGRRLRLEHPIYTAFAAFVTVLIPGISFWIIWTNYEEQVRRIIAIYAPKRTAWVLGGILLIAVTWLVTRLSLKLLDLMLRMLPRIRRRIRPWLRRRGIKLLPPRRRRATDEILEIDPRYHRGLKRAWKLAKPWVWRLLGVAITAAIFFYMFRKIALHWHDPAVRSRVGAISPLRFMLAAAMFAIFLFAFRAVSWRRILKGFGHRLHLAPATRIWSISELARYLPGSVWQVVGRVYLVKPYGIRGSICSTSQILELTTFLLANVLIAVACFIFLGTKTLGPEARPWLYGAMALVPLLAVLLHPKVFYGIANRVLAKVGKPPITLRLRGKKLVLLLVWNILGLLWQSLAVWLLVCGPLELPIEKWWVVAGAYCLAWCAGFLAVWAPGGLAVREVVFMAAMVVALPVKVRGHFETQASLAGMLAFLSLLLRLWTIVGELMVTGVAAAADYRGLLGLPGARGRVAVSDQPVSEEKDQPPTPVPSQGESGAAGSAAPSRSTSPAETPPTAQARPSAR